MTPTHRETVQASFADQAQSFEDPTRHFGNAEVLRWIAQHTPTTPDDVVLEVAAGTAIVARALAPLVRRVIATDLTVEMLEAGRRAATAGGLDNVAFHVADGGSLPFVDGCFDRVTCRLAIHHLETPSSLLAEMVRVCRGGGTITVIDMVAPDDASAARVLNELERMRDPSHTRALTRDELHLAVATAGARIVHTAARETVIVAARWLAQTNTPAAVATEVLARLEADIGGDQATGLQPRRADAGIEFAHHWELVVAEV